MRFRLLISALLIPVSILGQLSAPGSNAVRYTNYPSAPGVRDPVFVFCNSSGSIKGSLGAVSPGGAGPFNFSWFKWSDATRGFTVPISSESGVLNSSITNLDEGGYRVNITNGSGFSASFTGWIFIDSPGVSASLQNRTCDYVALKGSVSADTYFYNDPATGQQVLLPNGVRFRWSSEPASSIPYPEIELNPITFDPPLENVTYTLQVTDSMTCTNSSSFAYQSIHVKADFSVDPSEGEAPLEVTFTDKSVRAIKYKWEFGDDSVSVLKDPPVHTYYIPGEYSVKLTVESDLHCVDSLRFNKIKVEQSSLQVPNVFTPNGDGINDIFVIDKTSLKYISIKIFTRSGVKVYDFYGEGKILKDWEGWDGSVNNSNAKASPGVYFYVIKAQGWDDVKYDSKEYRGFVYLYR